MQNHPEFEFEVFYDGECPLCKAEIDLLRKWDRDRAIRFTDFTHSDFDLISVGKSYNELMSQIHGRTKEGQLVIGADVFRELYRLVGLGWLVQISEIPGMRQLTNLGYVIFARVRKFVYRKRCDAGSCGVSTGDRLREIES